MHRPNFESGTIWTQDNLLVLRGIDSECIDLIYLDPPFNSNKDYAARIDSKADGAEFSDRWTSHAVESEWVELIETEHPRLQRAIAAAQRDSDQAYLFYMASRLLEMHRVLKSTGSIWLHCDATMSHYLKIVMDAIFEKERFRNEVVWCYTGPGSPGRRQFNRKHDCLLWYSKGERWTFNNDAVRIPYKDGKPHVGGVEYECRGGEAVRGSREDTRDLVGGYRGRDPKFEGKYRLSHTKAFGLAAADHQRLQQRERYGLGSLLRQCDRLRGRGSSK